MVAMGTWTVHSDKDPRWNASGRAYGSAFGCPDLDAWVEYCRKKFGDPPDDATESFYKD